MFLFGKSAKMPDPAEALPGRSLEDYLGRMRSEKSPI